MYHPSGGFARGSLVSYEPSGAYVKIGKFDETGQFVDPDADPCEDCEDKYAPYCIWSCDHNDGWYTCSDCNEYRSDHCYEECQYNSDISPCDDCTDSGSEECYLRCKHNTTWERQDPCDDCQDKNCAECPWAEKKEQLEPKEEAAHAGTT